MFLLLFKNNFLNVHFYMPFDSCTDMPRHDQNEKIQMLGNNKMSFSSLRPHAVPTPTCFQ